MLPKLWTGHYLSVSWIEFVESVCALTMTPSCGNISFTNIPKILSYHSHINNECEEEWPYMYVYVVMAILGMVGNVFVMFTIIGVKRLRTAHNIFVLNLCSADLLLGINAIMLFADRLSNSWLMDNNLCRIFSFINFLPPFVVSLNMVVIAKMRHSAITHMGYIRIHLTRWRSVGWSAIVWMSAIIISLPLLAGVITSTSGMFCACCIYFTHNMIYGLIVSVLIYFIPNVLVTFYYIRIFVHVRASRRRVEQHQQPEGTTTVISSTF